MKLLIVGCEYTGTTTLAHAIRDWFESVTGTRIRLVHDHFKVPFTIGHAQQASGPSLITEEERAQYLALSPRLKESLQRHNIYYHTPNQAYFDADQDRIVVGLHIEDAIYGPHYFGYGGKGEEGDRRVISQHIAVRFARFAPDTVLVHVKASPETVRRRMKDNPHFSGVVQEDDVEFIMKRFEDEVARSAIRRKVALDTSEASVDESVAEFSKLMEPYFSDDDRMRILRYGTSDSKELS